MYVTCINSKTAMLGVVIVWFPTSNQVLRGYQRAGNPDY